MAVVITPKRGDSDPGTDDLVDGEIAIRKDVNPPKMFVRVGSNIREIGGGSGDANQTLTTGNGLTGANSGSDSDFTIAVGAGTGIDVAADAISVDVSDFMTNGADNRVLTATGTDAMNAEANMTFDGTDLTLGNDLNLHSDSSKIEFGANGEVYLTHSHNAGLIVSNQNTGDDNFTTLTLKSEQSVVENGEVISRLSFDADDSDGTDGSGPAASITAVAEADFTAGDNSTKLQFGLGESGTAISRTLFTMDHDGIFQFNHSSGGFTLDGNTITGIDDSGEFTDNDAHIMTSAGINDRFAQINADTTGNAGTATALATARTIAGQSFDGTANITIAPTDLTSVTATASEINILDGGLSASDIPNLATSKITSGTFADARIASSNVTQHSGDITSLGTLTTLTVDDITINGSTITDAGTLDFNIGGDLTFDVDGSDIHFKDDGQERFHFKLDSTPTLEVTGDFDIDCSGDITLDAAGDDIIFADAGAERFRFNLDGSPEIDVEGDFVLDATGQVDIESGGTSDIVLDSAGDIILDYADGDSIILKHNSTNNMLDISGTGSGNDVTFQLLQDGGDLIFKQYDGTEVARVEDGGLFDVVSNKLAINGTAITATAAELNLLDGKSFVDEDNMASNSATAIASQQSIKAYVDAEVAGAGGGASTGNYSFSSDTMSNSNAMTIDCGADINLDADGGDIVLKDGGAQFATLTNNSGGLIIKSGSTSVMRFDSAGSPEIGNAGIKQIGAWIFGHSNLDNGQGTKISWSSSNSNQGDIFNHRALMPAKGKIVKWIMKTDQGLSAGPGQPPMTVSLTGSSTSGQNDVTHADTESRFVSAVGGSGESLSGLIGYEWEAGDTIVGEITPTAGSDGRAQSSALIEWTY